MKITKWQVIAPKGRGHIATYTDKMESQLLRTNDFEKITVIDIEEHHALIRDLKSDPLFKNRIDRIDLKIELLKKASTEIREVLSQIRKITYDL